MELNTNIKRFYRVLVACGHNILKMELHYNISFIDTSHWFLVKNGILTINHSLYSLYLASRDFNSFFKLCLTKKGKSFDDIEAIQKTIFKYDKHSFDEFSDRVKRCIDAQANYFEWRKNNEFLFWMLSNFRWIDRVWTISSSSNIFW